MSKHNDVCEDNVRVRTLSVSSLKIMTISEDGAVSSKNREKKVQRKQKRLQHMITKDSGVVCCDNPTKYLAICNAGLTTGLDQATLVAEFSKFGVLSDVCLVREKSYCFVVCAEETSASRIYESAHGQSRLGQNGTVIYLTFCTEVPASKSDDPSQHSLPPGLSIIENFISPTEEEELMNLIKWNSSDGLLKHRQVEHYGYEFHYSTNNVDVNKPLTGKRIPKECDFIWDKLRNQSSNPVFNEPPQQLTVNKYEPGQGIPAHVDTHSAFKDTIVALSLASDIVMDFRKPTVSNSKEYVEHVGVKLPRRSLLVMSDECRYGWKHGITPRRIDIIRNVDGHLTTAFRTTRISFTFRWLSGVACACKYYSLCDSHSNRITTENKPEKLIENPSECEMENVHKVYDEIAGHFSETRHSTWPKVDEFIRQFEMGSALIDIGCGNGKYLQSNQNIFEIGCDRSEGLLNVCRERNFNVFRCDCLTVPFRTNSVDGCISIAVIHHLASEERRKRAIAEMIRVLRPNGRGLIYVWAKNQALKSKSSYLRQNKRNNQEGTDSADVNDKIESYNKVDDIERSKDSNSSLPIHTNRTQFEHTDLLVPWKFRDASKNKQKKDKNDESDKRPNKTFLRFYHVFEQNELENMCNQFTNITIEKSYYDQGNWCVIFKKLHPGE